MDWGQHISYISSKATKTLGFLHRNVAFAPKSTEEGAYKTLVRPKLEYAAPIWSPYAYCKVKKKAKFKNLYQIPHLILDTIWERGKNTVPGHFVP